MKEAKLIRFFMVALPSGLLVFGIAAMLGSQWWGGRHGSDPNESIRLEAAALKRLPVSRDHLENSVRILAERIGERHLGQPEALESAAFWIESSLGGGNLGYLVERQTYGVGDREVRNLIAELPGREHRGEIVVVGAHYDSAPGSTGANDNATGVAALLSLARAFTGDPQGRTIRFVAFVNGGPPHFQTETMGSRVYASRCRARGERIVAMLCLDEVGQPSALGGGQQMPGGREGADAPGKGDGLAFVGDGESTYWLDSAKGAFGASSSLSAFGGVVPPDAPHRARSDHESFREAGFPAVLITDRPNQGDPQAPLPGDSAGRIDFGKLEEAARGFEAIVRTWANP